jgi:protein phosphatase
MKLIASGMRHQGRQRPHNEDSFFIADSLELYAVADGVESEPFGEVASQMAVQELENIIKSMSALDSDATPPFEYAEGIPMAARALKFAFREVNRKIFEKADSEAKYNGMCTTLTALWAQGGRIYIGNVGDSRAYLIRRGHIHQLTHDHTALAQGDSAQPVHLEFMEEYSSTSEHELTRAMGVNKDIEVQLSGGTPKAGDIVLLCTDGLYLEIRDFEIMDTARAYEPMTAAKKLIELANERGGMDNVALVVIKIE